MIFLLVFAYKSKIAKAYGYDCLNCKHLPNVCKFLLGLDAQILDTAFSSGAERCQKRSAFSQYWGLHFVQLPPILHHFIIHPVLLILCLTDVKRAISSDHSSCIYHPFTHRIINYLCEPCTVRYELFIQVVYDSWLYRTSGVIFFIDYCTAIRDT